MSSASTAFCLFLLISTIALGATVPSRAKRAAGNPGLVSSLANPVIDPLQRFYALYVSMITAIPVIGPIIGGVLAALNPVSMIGTATEAVDGVVTPFTGALGGLGNLGLGGPAGGIGGPKPTGIPAVVPAATTAAAPGVAA